MLEKLLNIVSLGGYLKAIANIIYTDYYYGEIKRDKNIHEPRVWVCLQVIV